MVTTISTEELRGLEGQELEPSEWLEISQQRVNLFAEATNDYQFIHCDPEKAKDTPFGGTIAHGFLTLSLISFLNEQNAMLPEGMVMGINYGSDKVRFISPVKVGQRIRSHQKVLRVTNKMGQWLIKTAVTIEIENEKKPALVAEVLGMFVVE